MAINPSGPEMRAKCLFERLQLSARIKDNDGTANCKRLLFSDDRKGTSVIRDGILYRDWERASPKNFKYTRPDKVFDSTDYLEIKDKIDSADWHRLSRDSFNDQMRLSLLRIQEGLISCRVYHHSELSPDEQYVATSCLRNPTERRYMRFSELTRVVTSPVCNLEPAWLDNRGMRLPIKVLAGIKARPKGRLFILDSQMMDEWDKVTQ
jgi:hypothetical protein